MWLICEQLNCTLYTFFWIDAYLLKQFRCALSKSIQLSKIIAWNVAYYRYPTKINKRTNGIISHVSEMSLARIVTSCRYPNERAQTKCTWMFTLLHFANIWWHNLTSKLSKSVWMNSQKIKCVLFSLKLIEVRDTVAFCVDARFARNLNVILFCERKTPDLCI